MNSRMKIFSPILLVCVLAQPSFAQDAKTNAAPAQAAKKPAAVVTLPASAGEISKPLVLKDEAISQPEQTDVSEGGKATYSFTLTNAGNYVLHAMVNAPGETENSFYLNIDAQPEDPMMIWDI